MRARYSSVKNSVSTYSVTRSAVSASGGSRCMLSSITSATLSRMHPISARSNSRPLRVSDSKQWYILFALNPHCAENAASAVAVF